MSSLKVYGWRRKVNDPLVKENGPKNLNPKHFTLRTYSLDRILSDKLLYDKFPDDVSEHFRQNMSYYKKYKWTAFLSYACREYVSLVQYQIGSSLSNKTCIESHSQMISLCDFSFLTLIWLLYHFLFDHFLFSQPFLGFRLCPAQIISINCIIYVIVIWSGWFQ